MAGAPWAVQYFDDLRGQVWDYWPFTEDRPQDVASRYINISDWVRRSWEPPGSADAIPTIWFFGGSAMFGEGQRDAHTVPSEVARLASAAGIPVKVANYGQRGWVHYQEMLLYEQRLATRARPDLAVFYDGPNDLQAAALFKEAIPSSLHADEYAQALRGHRLTTVVDVPEPSGSLPGAVWKAYRAHSAVVKVAEAAGIVPTRADASPGERAQPAPSSTSVPARGGDTASQVTGTRNQDGNIEWGTEEDGRQAMQVYERGRFLSTQLSDEADVQPFFFWQPVATHQDAVAYARAHLTEPTIDLSDVFGGRDVYIDTTHTNEAGAELVAAAMWERIEPAVRAWYRAHR